MVPCLLLRELFYHQKELDMIKNLTEEQKHILLEEGTEPPGTSPLNYEKRDGDYCCEDVVLNSLNLKKNLKVEVDGRLFLNRCLMYLKRKLIH